MYVVKRDGRKEPMMFDKITARVRKLCYGLNELVDPVKVAMRVIEGLYDGVTTSELDNLAAEIAATLTTAHPDYAKLAARISVSNLHKNTKKSFYETMKDLHEYINPRTGKKAPLLSDEVFKVIAENADMLDSTIIYNRDFGYDYFGFKTLERSYLLKLNGKIAERPQHMLMRVAVGIHLDDLESAVETFYRLRALEGVEKRPATRELINWIRALRTDPDFNPSPRTVNGARFRGATPQGWHHEHDHDERTRNRSPTDFRGVAAQEHIATAVAP